MTSVELLERAAAKLRDHANAAQKDDWFAAGPWMKDCPLELAEMLPHGFVAAGVECVPVLLAPPYGELPYRACLDFVALMHPPVALALADLLTVLSWMPSSADPTDMHAATKVARAILREEGP